MTLATPGETIWNTYYFWFHSVLETKAALKLKDNENWKTMIAFLSFMNASNHMIVLEYANECSLRQYISLVTKNLSEIISDANIESQSQPYIQWTIKPALAGKKDAMFNVGYSYDLGLVVEPNVAQYDLGWSYNYGEGIDGDYKKAFEWYKKAAEINFSNSQYMLGKYFYEGYETKKDIINAVNWLNEAMKMGILIIMNY
ncbi:hypothetical protein Glove_198g117 [Diversispora epigaea]|uniref:Uncharacterized protein n=1 Tax=Diversispora epigaea TaxID=1348612 RepID=A0A397IK19_9GLOM|nr:hypothetical protein Glove_198g117 [Diversispora epigaea]